MQETKFISIVKIAKWIFKLIVSYAYQAAIFSSINRFKSFDNYHAIRTD